MNSTVPAGLPVASVRIRRFMVVAWVAIIAKCLLVAWAVDHWQMPFSATWVIAPTLVFAALATVVWLIGRE